MALSLTAKSYGHWTELQGTHFTELTYRKKNTSEDQFATKSHAAIACLPASRVFRV
jgi:hypothetical protein